LRRRAQDAEATIQRRLADSRVDLAHADEFDYVVVNDDFDNALADLVAIVRAERLRTPVQRRRLGGLLSELGSD
jgi:guanylate kinase